MSTKAATLRERADAADAAKEAKTLDRIRAAAMESRAQALMRLGELEEPTDGELDAMAEAFEAREPSCPRCGGTMDSAGACGFIARDGSAITLPSVWLCDPCGVQIDR